MTFKYLKPRSLTWWSSATPLAAGLLIATEPMHGATATVQAVSNMTGGASAYTLINLGLAGIGLRGAFDK